MSARGVYRLTMLFVIVTCVIVSYVVLARRADGHPQQPGPRPAFQLPFPCGESWSLTTYAGHDDYDIDFFYDGGPSGGRAVLASAAGTVAWSGWQATLDTGAPAAPGTIGTRGGLGFGVIIDHGGGWFSSYGHLQTWPEVKQDQSVKQGQLLGHVGRTGATKVEHLHYEQHDDTRDPDHTRGNADKVESVFDGVPSGITTDGNAGTGPIRTAGPVSPTQHRTSRNCP
ncbi:M23 family metallopeptidase [Dactylosporangium aurantiacum]|uniref:M23 family metallopeptidase n=1 Tax=Dactylosporangium aurantiacum TaxID=35754 RepID=A0A9Q9ILK8_9ACTN|nr:M23 family metallopeptidase [Dactylosporangium aurantiacum]MDG6103312.1 M23 family metallopeptidase [Dactylosporangium aurantiacum]UWZ57811.1 M23 family metallopeptidase [Dactylosporangium aurantiacum]